MIHGWAVLLVLCTLLLLLCPAASGPYSATHGPVTALRNLHLWVLVCVSLLVAAKALSFWRPFAVALVRGRISREDRTPACHHVSPTGCVLRC